MAHLLEIALSNLIVASLLALLAALAGLWGKRPALTHALWLLVMLKLVTPPFLSVPIDWPTPLTAEPAPIALHAVELKVEPPIEWHDIEPPMENDAMLLPNVVAVEPIAEPAPSVIPVIFPEAEPMIVATRWPWLEMFAAIWLLGSVSWLSLAAVRLLRFGRMLRHAQPASVEIRLLAEHLAADMGIRCPRVCVVPGRISPMLWALWGAPRLVLPSELLGRLPADQLATLLVHELAHWRRRDDRTRWLEIVVLAVYWWCPLVWWGRRELHQAEEECCDAWVVSQLPESAKAYALALVETVDFLADAPMTLPTAASGLGQVRLLKRRLTMILNGKTPRALTLTGLLGVAGVGLLLLPMAPGWAQQNQQNQQNRDEERQEPRGKKEGREKGPGDGPKGDELRALHAQIEQLKAEMAMRSAQMNMLMDHLRRMEQAKQGDGWKPLGPVGGEGKKKKGGEREGNNQGGQGGGGQGGPGGGGGGIGGRGFGGAQAGGGGFGGFGGAGAGPGMAGSRSPVDQRLNDVERKLDQLLQEIRSMRNDMRNKDGMPGANPMRNPNANPGGRAGGLPPTGAPTPPRQRNIQNEN